MLKSRFVIKSLLVFLLFQYKLSKTNAVSSLAQFKRSHQSTLPQNQQHLHNLQPQGQTHEKDAMELITKHDSTPQAIELFGNSYQMTNEFRHPDIQTTAASQPPTNFAQSLTWNPNPFVNQANNMDFPTSAGEHISFPYSPYNAASMQFSSFSSPPGIMETPKFFPFIGFPQAMVIPLPLIYPPTITEPTIYTAFANGINKFEEAMSRGIGARRTANARDSPIYYMRLPPTPYMLLPNLEYAQTPSIFAGFHPVSAFSNLSPTFNLPLSFMANGKPSGIYQMTSLPPNAFQGSYAATNVNFNDRPSMQANDFFGNYAAQRPQPNHDSRMTLLKQPFIFNGRPDEMYILQNSFNPMLGGI